MIVRRLNVAFFVACCSLCFGDLVVIDNADNGHVNLLSIVCLAVFNAALRLFDYTCFVCAVEFLSSFICCASGVVLL